MSFKNRLSNQDQRGIFADCGFATGVMGQIAMIAVNWENLQGDVVADVYSYPDEKLFTEMCRAHGFDEDLTERVLSKIVDGSVCWILLDELVFKKTLEKERLGQS